MLLCLLGVSENWEELVVHRLAVVFLVVFALLFFQRGSISENSNRLVCWKILNFGRSQGSLFEINCAKVWIYHLLKDPAIVWAYGRAILRSDVAHSIFIRNVDRGNLLLFLHQGDKGIRLPFWGFTRNWLEFRLRLIHWLKVLNLVRLLLYLEGIFKLLCLFDWFALHHWLIQILLLEDLFFNFILETN